jgi:hypothetical protein
MFPIFFFPFLFTTCLTTEYPGMLGTLVGLYFLHRRTREQEREKRTQYWHEQVILSFPAVYHPGLTLVSECLPSKHSANARHCASVFTLAVAP